MSRFDHDYTTLASDGSLSTIASLHRMQDHIFVYKTLHHFICSNFIIELFGQRQLIYKFRCRITKLPKKCFSSMAYNNLNGQRDLIFINQTD